MFGAKGLHVKIHPAQKWNWNSIITVYGRSKNLNILSYKKRERGSFDEACITPVSVDYYNESLFRFQIGQSIHSYGPYDLVVAWIHHHDKQIIDIIDSEIRKDSSQKWILVHVLGSSSNLEEIDRGMDLIKNSDYYQVQFGFIIEGNSPRWLTHKEISNGVIHCIKSKTRKHLVGTLTPWSRRP